MVDKKLILLIHRIKDRTKDGSIIWDRTSEEDAFIASFRNYSIQISIEPTRNPNYTATDVVLKIFDYSGNIVEEVRDTDFDDDELPNPYEFLNEIYSIARRQAMGVDKAIDTLLEELTKDDDIPF
jgi:hypothetical protein